MFSVIFDDDAVEIVETYYRMGQAAQEKLERDVLVWHETVDKFSQKDMNDRKTVEVMTTPLAMTLAGAELLPITVTVGGLRHILEEKHEGKITADILKQVPEKLADPIMILKLKPTERRPAESLVVMLDLKDSKGNTINVPILLSKEEGGVAPGYHVNQINTVFGREFDHEGPRKGPNDQWFIDQAFKTLPDVRGKKEWQLKYLNRKKVSQWGESRGKKGPINFLIGKLGSIVPNETYLDKAHQRNSGLYQETKGQAAFTDSQSMIRLFQTADRSTLLHETAHVFLNDLMRLAETNEAAARDLKAAFDWLEVPETGWESLSAAERTAAHEKFARTFEAYLMNGEAPTAGLRRVFRAFRAWLREIYTSIEGLIREAGQEIELSDEARDFFDSMLATDAEIEVQATLAGYEAALEATDESRELHREATERLREKLNRVPDAELLEQQRKEITEAVTKTVMESRPYRMQSEMKQSAAKGGRKINEKELIQLYGKEFFDEHFSGSGMTSKTSKWTLDDLALTYGYPDGDSMVREIVELKPAKQAGLLWPLLQRGDAYEQTGKIPLSRDIGV